MSDTPKQDDARRHLESARVALGNLKNAKPGDVAWKHALGHLGLAVERLRELGVDGAGTVSDPDPDRPALDPFHPDGA